MKTKFDVILVLDYVILEVITQEIEKLALTPLINLNKPLSFKLVQNIRVQLIIGQAPVLV